jgi:hypothetical protein
VALVLALVPAGASAASPVLEFVVPGHGFPTPFTTESGPVNAEMVGFSSLVHCAASRGEGEITGPRSAVAEYQLTGCVTEKGSSTKCKSEHANTEEITTGPIDAELVFIDQAKHEVAILLDPSGGTYIAFECGSESAEGRGPFLAPADPVNTEATTFTAILSQSSAAQEPDEYETLTGAKIPAIPMGKHGTGALVTTGVEAAFTIHPSWPGEIKALTAQEVEAAQLGEEVKRLQAALQKQEETLKKAEEHVTQLDAANTQLAAAALKAEDEVAATRRKLEELEARSRPPSRAELLAKALRACKTRPKKQRARCVASAHRKYGTGTEQALRSLTRA